MKPVKVKDLIDKLDFQMKGWRQFYNKKTGIFLEIQEQYLGIAEELDEEEDLSTYQDWKQEEIEAAM